MGWCRPSDEALPNRLDNTISINEYFIVPKTHNDKPGLLQNVGTSNVLQTLAIMLTSVKFDHDVPFKADKIENEISEGMLSAEFAIFQLSAFEVLPQFVLGIRRRVA